MRPAYRALLSALAALTLVVAFAATASAESQSYVVQPGDTIFKISLRFGVSMDAIRAANGIVGDRIFYGQTLIIPDPNAPISSPPAATTGDVIHVVQRGETLFTIGLRYGMLWTKIQAANGLPGATVWVGQRLVIPTSGSTTPPADTGNTTPPDVSNTPPPADTNSTPPSDSSGNVIYTVQRGDTLHLIGVRYNIAWPAIQSANGLADTRIFVGQRLIIPVNGAGTVTPEVNAPPPPAENAGGKRFLVDLSEQRLYAYEGDTMVRTTLISSGIARYPTVTGTFYIYARYVSTRMVGPGYNLPNVPYTMYFYKGYGLHGTYWHNNFGTPMSHGCVNMPTPEAEWAFNWSTYGTPVIVQP